MRTISSFIVAVSMLAVPSASIAGECIIFTDENLKGDSYLILDGESADLRNAKRGMGGFGNFNDETSSIEVKSGTCTVYQDINFGGLSKTLGVGKYNNGNEMGFMNDEISSVRSPK